jgi:hypothetical protein
MKTELLQILTRMSLVEIANLFDNIVSSLGIDLNAKESIEFLARKQNLVLMAIEPWSNEAVSDEDREGRYEEDIYILLRDYPEAYFKIFEAPFLDDPDGLDRPGMSAEDRYEEDISFLYSEEYATYASIFNNPPREFEEDVFALEMLPPL